MRVESYMEPFVQSTLAAALQRLARIDRALTEMHAGTPLTIDQIGKLHCDALVAAESVRSAMALMEIDVPAPAPVLRLVKP